MGLDVVELVLSCEEVFGISIPDGEAERFQRVGDLYRQICTRLNLRSDLRFPVPVKLPPLPAYRFGSPSLSLTRSDETSPPWTPEKVWVAVIALICDQMQVKPEDLSYEARMQEDLGMD